MGHAANEPSAADHKPAVKAIFIQKLTIAQDFALLLHSPNPSRPWVGYFLTPRTGLQHQDLPTPRVYAHKSLNSRRSSTKHHKSQSKISPELNPKIKEHIRTYQSFMAGGKAAPIQAANPGAEHPTCKPQGLLTCPSYGPGQHDPAGAAAVTAPVTVTAPAPAPAPAPAATDERKRNL